MVAESVGKRKKEGLVEKIIEALISQNDWEEWQASRALRWKSVHLNKKAGEEFYFCNFSTVHKPSYFVVSVTLIIACDYRHAEVDYKRDHVFIVKVKNFHRPDVNRCTEVLIDKDSDNYEYIKEFVDALLANVEDEHEKNISALAAAFS